MNFLSAVVKPTVIIEIKTAKNIEADFHRNSLILKKSSIKK